LATGNSVRIKRLLEERQHSLQEIDGHFAYGVGRSRCWRRSNCFSRSFRVVRCYLRHGARWRICRARSTVTRFVRASSHRENAEQGNGDT